MISFMFKQIIGKEYDVLINGLGQFSFINRDGVCLPWPNCHIDRYEYMGKIMYYLRGKDIG